MSSTNYDTSKSNASFLERSIYSNRAIRSAWPVTEVLLIVSLRRSKGVEIYLMSILKTTLTRSKIVA